MIKKVTAVVVTYNRKELLVECLDALCTQSYPIDTIIVFDNASTDGTTKLFTEGNYSNKKNIQYVRSNENLGGAGGFHNSIKLAVDKENEFVWIMDDDTIPTVSALEELIRAYRILEREKETVSFLASYIYGPNMEPMNVPVISNEITDNGYSFWYKYLNEGLVCIKEATFVSLLIPIEVVKKVGLPISDYYIWGDDTEYTRRLFNKYGNAYMVGKSLVLHKRFNAKKISIINETNVNRINLYHYYYRNALLNSYKYENKSKLLLRILGYSGLSLKVMFTSGKFGLKKFIAIQKGIFEFLFNSQSIKKVNK